MVLAVQKIKFLRRNSIEKTEKQIKENTLKEKNFLKKIIDQFLFQ